MNRVSSEESQNEHEGARRAIFEETYPRYEFAELVRIGLVLAQWLAARVGWPTRGSRRMERAALGDSGKLSPGKVHPAE